MKTWEAIVKSGEAEEYGYHARPYFLEAEGDGTPLIPFIILGAPPRIMDRKKEEERKRYCYGYSITHDSKFEGFYIFGHHIKYGGEV